MTRTPADNQTVRNVFVIDPGKRIQLVFAYPMTTGRNFDEILRVIDSLQLTAEHQVATPVNWRQGDDVIIAGSVSDNRARERFGHWHAPGPTFGSSRSRESATRRLSCPLGAPEVAGRTRVAKSTVDPHFTGPDAQDRGVA